MFRFAFFSSISGLWWWFSGERIRSASGQSWQFIACRLSWTWSGLCRRWLVSRSIVSIPNPSIQSSRGMNTSRSILTIELSSLHHRLARGRSIWIFFQVLVFQRRLEIYWQNVAQPIVHLSLGKKVVATVHPSLNIVWNGLGEKMSHSCNSIVERTLATKQKA